MKVLFLGHYREGTGWAKAAQGLIHAMHSVGIDLVCRNIELTKSENVSPLICDLEKGDINNVDICIQHLLPHHLIGTNKFKKNIAYCVFESTNLVHNSWLSNLKYMDEVWVPCKDNKNELEQHNIKTSIIPHAFDMGKYKLKTENEGLDLSSYGLKSAYKFYTIMDLTLRKNLSSIVKSYYATFKPHEDVVLIIKANKAGYDKRSVYSAIHQACADIRKKMGLYDDDNNYNNIIVIGDKFSEEEIDRLHISSDCFVNLSHGESWSIPSFDAMCYGNHPICTNWGGPKEYIDTDNKNTGTLIECVMQTCSNIDSAFSHLFRGNEFWATPDEQKASQAMRYYFEKGKTKNQEGLSCGEKFSYQSVGNLIKETLKL